MNMDDAKKIERPPIKDGEQYTFYSTMQQEYLKPAQRMRNYTGKLVTVLGKIEPTDYVNDDDEPMFKVQAADGFEFAAYEGELNGWFVDTGQFFWPDATWGHDHDTFALANEKETT